MSRLARSLSVAMVGTRGVPARYGGFETCVEEVGSRLAARGHDVVVYCRRRGPETADEAQEFKGMRLVHFGALQKRSLETLSHTGLSVAHLARNRTDAAIVFNSANAPWMPVLRAARIPFATHVDGLEWKREKWGPIGRRYYLLAERLSVKLSNELIADAGGIRDYYRDKFGVGTDLIAYGAPRISSDGGLRIAELGLERRGYHLVVARFEPENHVDMIVAGYRASNSKKPLVVVGSAPYADDYTRKVHSAADDRVRFVGGIWDQELLDQLYANADTYLHGHSVGGTNPSLLRAMGAGTPSTAFDVVFNREVLGNAGRYFSSAQELTRQIEVSEFDAAGTRRLGELATIGAARYDWDDVADRYEELCYRLASGERQNSQIDDEAGRPRVSNLSLLRAESDQHQLDHAVVQGGVTAGSFGRLSATGHPRMMSLQSKTTDWRHDDQHRTA